VFRATMSKRNETKLSPRLRDALSTNEVTIESGPKTGLVFTPLAIEQQWTFSLFEQFDEFEERLWMRQIGGSQMKVVIVDSERVEIDLPSRLVARVRPAKIDGSTDTQLLEDGLEISSGSRSPGDPPGSRRIERMQVRAQAVIPDSFQRGWQSGLLHQGG